MVRDHELQALSLHGARYLRGAAPDAGHFASSLKQLPIKRWIPDRPYSRPTDLNPTEHSCARETEAFTNAP